VHVLQVDSFQVSVAKLLGTVVGHHLAALHDSGPGARLLRAEQIMRCHQNRSASAAELFQKFRELIGSLGIESGGRFIEQRMPFE